MTSIFKTFIKTFVKSKLRSSYSYYCPSKVPFMLIQNRPYSSHHFSKDLKRLIFPNFQNSIPNNSYRILIAVSLAQIFEWAGLKREDENEIKKLISKAKHVLENGNINEAADLYNRALQQATSHHDSEEEFLIKQQLAIIAFSLRKFNDAEKLLLEVNNYLANNKTDDDIRKSHVTLRLAETYEYLNNFEKAEQYYDACTSKLKPKIKEAIETKHEEIIELWLSILASQAHYFLHRGNFEKAELYFKEAYDTCVRVKGEISEHSVTLLYQLGAVCFQKGDLEIAVHYLKKAVEIGKHLPGMITLSNIYVTLGNIYLKQGLIKDAEVLCGQAYKNAVRHKYEKGIEEANACLKELTEAV